MARARFRDRRDAGRMLADALVRYGGAEPTVLGLPPGGVTVAAELARALDAPLDLMLVGALRAPRHEGLMIGAVASGDALVLNQDLLRELPLRESALRPLIERERRRLNGREHDLRGDRPFPYLRGRTVILVDDGHTSGAVMRMALLALRQSSPRRVVAAVPVAPPGMAERLRRLADDVTVLLTPTPFFGPGCWYEDFEEVSDEVVRAELARAWRPAPEPAGVELSPPRTDRPTAPIPVVPGSPDSY